MKYLLDTNICIYPVLPLFADTKALLRQQGKLIDDFDLLIGTTALKDNIREFGIRNLSKT